MSDFWNPKNETMPREDLDRLRLLKLKALCEWAMANSPFHHRKFEAAGFSPDQLKSLDDMQRIPVMTRSEWMDCQAETPLFGDLITAPREQAIRYHLTSGTSGRQPLRVLDGMKDQPLRMDEARHIAQQWWTARDVDRVFPHEAATQQFLAWLEQFSLGRKRLLDTLLAATYHQAGIPSVLTTNPADFATFGIFTCITPSAPASPS